MSTINPGDVVRITGAFTNLAGVAADPTAVTLRVRLRRSGETQTEYTGVQVTKDSTDNFHVDYTVPSIAPDRGLAIEYEWQGTGAVAAVEQGTFSVADSYG